jgi:hypothetical protein
MSDTNAKTGLPEPIQGDWYWVRFGKDDDFFPAIRDVRTERTDPNAEYGAPGGWSTGSSGGWTNGDTWEDVDGKVTEWHRIPWPGESA